MKSLGIIVILVMIVIGYLFFQNNTFLQRFSLTKITDESITQRQELISQSINMFTKAPIFGIGINNFFNNLNISNIKSLTLLIQPVHNIFLLVLSETGLIGLGFFLYVFYKCFKQAYLLKTKEIKYLLLVLFTVIFLGFFDHYFLTLQQGQLMLSLALGTALSYRKP
jgi:O-antigen ligase